ncbi:fumarylacetoacetate hydrolase [Sorangium cellulosum]|uniref:Fumarylacetoacetate hydrolase n=1 Tax=Sorangium cellulosum TaxID=56 RepID=A0A4P2Q8J2_SORCE|nr:fumarylacetoacetate hydrolase family protein [Sorangium cellulosum]AUX25897.1 fumarylacetoacetate hydrolase [Sorangium cellulosum]
MRIAHVFQLTTSTPIVALERDGALYDVAELERHFATKLADLPGVSDFHTRVVALRCAGLHALDERLLSGDRPGSAELQPGTFLWLPPCATDRAAYVQLGPYAHDAERPWYRFGNSRALLGHAATIPFPALEDEPDYELNLAALLCEDLRRATPEEAERAIAGYTVLNDWTARGLEARAQARGRPTSEAKDFATQLGPVLVTPDELGPVEVLRTRIRVDAEARVGPRLGEWTFSLTESLACISAQIELRAGDVIGAGRVLGGSAGSAGQRVLYGASVELMIERIGWLAGRPVRGPEPPPWRRR